MEANNDKTPTLYSLLKEQFPCLSSFLGLGASLSCSRMRWCSNLSTSSSSSLIRQLPYRPEKTVQTRSPMRGDRPRRSPRVRQCARSLGRSRRVRRNSEYTIYRGVGKRG